MILILSLAIAVLFGSGAYLLLKRDLIRVILGTVLIGNAANLFIMSAGLRRGAAPIYPLSSTVADPLVQSLLSSGLIRPDAQGLGIDVADDGRPLSRDGAPVDRLYYLGPWLRARDWEATAVPELREHAAALARSLTARSLAARSVARRNPADSHRESV